ncbi:MAG TPA: PfkB family carbohydrate kinase [Anaerolineales bacterium]|nr:PfkB family carbohydrate kinase [Anaerolineales bacterium]
MIFRYNLDMYRTTHLEPVDYLVIGHITTDLTSDGLRLGGTASYASLTARALGLKVGIVTSWGAELPLGDLHQIPIVNLSAEKSTTFENVPTPEGRIQIIHSVAHRLDLNLIPETWLNAPIVHLGPVAQEVEPGLIRHFPNSLIGLTPQGWMREWDSSGRVTYSEWPEATFMLGQAGAAVISLEDIGNVENRIEELAAYCRILAVTEEARGSRLYWNGDVRRFPAPAIPEVDAVGAGDIFSAAFFYRLYTTRDPWEAARFATHLASLSISRPGLEGIPTPEEVSESLFEIQ